MTGQRTMNPLWDAMAVSLAAHVLGDSRRHYPNMFRIRCLNGERIVWAFVAKVAPAVGSPLIRLRELVKIAGGLDLGAGSSRDGLAVAVIFETYGTAAFLEEASPIDWSAQNTA